MAITDAATIRHMSAYAFLNPFKDIASLLVPDEEDTHLRNKVNQQLPAHLSNPMLRVLLTGLTYIALAATFFGIFLLREAASMDVSDFSKTVKASVEKETAIKQSRLESALAKLGMRNTPPASSESDEETIASASDSDLDLDLDSDGSSNWGSPPTSSDENSATDNDMRSLSTRLIQEPVTGLKKRVLRHHKRAENFDFSSTQQWRRPDNGNLNSDKRFDDILNRTIKIPLPPPLEESVEDSSWTLPPNTCSESDNSSKPIYSPVTTIDDELTMSYSLSEVDSDDNDMPSLIIESDEDSSWASAPPSPIDNQAAAIYPSVHLSDIPHSSNGNHEFIGKKEELSL